MNEEFDSYMGALVADLIYRQHVLRSQVKQNLEQVDNFANSELSQMLIEDLGRTDHLVYVDTAMVMTPEETLALKQQQPIDY